MKHNDIAIGIVVNQLMERSMKDSTPKKLATPMFEAAEIIRQLLAERDKAQKGLEQAQKTLDQAVAALKAHDYCGDCAHEKRVGCELPGRECRWEWKGARQREC